ncbi:N-acetylmuramoyl-L-alanine amidase [Marinicrinis sediminis]|uniref:N-acetylmuramoyl-L-alanine amidase n=1 Tax=Marinicrinis sediminis TaxID=1652465 RepID=A0ABW5R5I2_9BACL
MDIQWKGNKYTNFSSRQGYVPFVIVNHISVGSMSSMDAWFTSPENRVSSAHFGVSRQGAIHQYVDIERMAWTQGIPDKQIPRATAQVVQKMGVNPNLYAVSIEHEGKVGNLTEAQFEASVWLHRYIQDRIFDQWQRSFPLDTYHVIGHDQVNPSGKPYCPGPQFPWERLYAALGQVDRVKEEQLMEDIRERMAELEKWHEELSGQVRALERLHALPQVPEWASEAVDAAVKQGLVLNPEQSSYDFYRVLTILHRKGLI